MSFFRAGDFLPARPISEPEHLDFGGSIFLRESSIRLFVGRSSRLWGGIGRALGALSQGQQDETAAGRAMGRGIDRVAVAASASLFVFLCAIDISAGQGEYWKRGG